MVVKIKSGWAASLLLAVSLLSVQTTAAQVSGISEADFFDAAPLILTASRMSKPLLESPASVTVIDRETIKKSGVREISDIFRLVPGFIIANFNANRPVVTYHGLGNDFMRQLQVLVDGRSVFVPSFGGVPWTNLPLLLEDIERVEVIRGPNAVTYGANAFLATINIITRHSAEDIGASYTLSSSGGSTPRVRDAYLRLGYHHDDLDWRLSLGSLEDDGFEDVNDSRDTAKINFRLDYAAQHNQLWTFQIGTSQSIDGLGRLGEDTNMVRDSDATNSYVNINWELIGDSSTTNIRLAHTDQSVEDSFDPSPLTFAGISGITTFIDFDRDSNRTDLEIIRTDELSQDLRVVYGASLRKDRVKSLFLLNKTEFVDVDTSRLFTSIEWRFADDWILDLGTTLEDSSVTDQEYSPRLTLLHTLNHQHVVRFVASSAKRNPILYEIEGLSVFSANVTLPPFGNIDFDVKTYEGNPDIDPENIESFEIGLRSQIAANSISSDLKLFSYEITDFIQDVFNDDVDPLLGPIEVQTTTNLDEIKVRGIEASVDVSPIPSWLIRSGFTVLKVDSDNNRLERSFADYSAFISSGHQFNDAHSLTASAYYIDETQWFSTRDITPDIKKLDLRYAYTIDKLSETTLEIIGYNLLEDFPDYFAENINEKSFLLRLSGSF